MTLVPDREWCLVIASALHKGDGGHVGGRKRLLELAPSGIHWLRAPASSRQGCQGQHWSTWQGFLGGVQLGLHLLEKEPQQ